MVRVSSVLRVLCAAAVVTNFVAASSAGQPFQQQRQQQQQQQQQQQRQQQQQQQQQQGFNCVKANVNVNFQGGKGDPSLVEGQVLQFDISLPDSVNKQAPATVTLKPSPVLALSQTTFSFNGAKDQSKYTVLAKVNTASAAQFKTGDRAPIAIDWKYPSHLECQQSTQTVNVQITKKDGFTGQLLGDPHIITFDGAKFDFMNPGVYKFVDGKNFQVQGAIRQCANNNIGCVYGVAVQVGSSIARLVIEGNQIVLAKGSSQQQQQQFDNLSVEKQKDRPNFYRVFVKSDPSTYVDVNMNAFNGGNLLDVTVRLSPYMAANGVQGILGNANGNPNDDERDANRLAAAYQVNGGNLFTCATAGCKGMMKGALESDAIKLDPVPLLHEGYAPVEDASIPERSSVLMTTRRLREQEHRRLALDEAKVNQLCTKVIESVPRCGEYVKDRAFYVDVCTKDTVLLGDMANIDQAKGAYMRACRREMDAAIALNANATPESTDVVKEARTSLSLGNSDACPDNCNGHGTCQLNGCKCEAGFSGFGCSIEL